jgi:hypothetical protein
MFQKQLRSQRTRRGITEGDIQLTVAEHRVAMKVARPDRRPNVVDDHQLIMDVHDVPSAVGSLPSDSRQREVGMTVKRSTLWRE